MSAKTISDSSVWQVSITIPKCLDEPVTEMLSVLLHQPASAYCPLESDIAIVSAFLTERSKWSREHSQNLKKQVLEFFPEETHDLIWKVTCRKIKANDWQESWKRHFKPLEIGNRLLIIPSWNKRKPKKNQSLIILDPGLSFGTGQHATTRFCLEEI